MTIQNRWRIIGGVALGVSALMALVGVHWQWLRHSLMVLAVYWAVFFVFFAVAIFCAILDVRYIRMEYALGKKELFRETLGDEAFRKALRDAQVKSTERNKGEYN